MNNSWLIHLTGRSDYALRLFCFHYAGGNANIFRLWYKGLPEQIQVVPVELPGHGTRLRESLIDRLSFLVEEAGKAIAGYLDKPFAFFGHSMGALISFELVRFLRRHQLRQPMHLFVSAHSAPHLPGTHDPIHALPEDEFVRELRSLNGTSDEVLRNRELMALLQPVMRADFKVCETYQFRPQPPLDIPITAFGGTDDKDVTESTLRSWEEHTLSEFKLRMLPGDHFFIHTRQAELLQYLSMELSVLLTKGEKML
ncbi:MAG: alpha/beta fold hydrolase [Actinobacteria bacterium]|nr:alpha/beta fold hydrolase [Actinomycetota bacterium]